MPSKSRAVRLCPVHLSFRWTAMHSAPESSAAICNLFTRHHLLQPLSRFGTMTLWPAGVVHTHQRSLSRSAAPCLQLYKGSHAPGSHLCAGSYIAPIFANSCVTVGVTAPLRIHYVEEFSKAVKLQQHLFSVPEHPYRLGFLNGHSMTVIIVRRLGVLGTADTAQHSSGSKPCGSARHWAELNT